MGAYLNSSLDNIKCSVVRDQEMFCLHDLIVVKGFFCSELFATLTLLASILHCKFVSASGYKAIKKV